MSKLAPPVDIVASVKLDALIAEIQLNPWKLRHLRAEINAELGRPSQDVLSDVFEKSWKQKSSQPTASSSLYEVVAIGTVADVLKLSSSGEAIFPRPNFLTADRPSAIVSRMANALQSGADQNSLKEIKGYVSPIQGYISRNGSFALSFYQDVPIMFDVGAAEKRIIYDQSSRNYDAFYAFGGARCWSEPEYSVNTTGIIYDEFVGNNYCHWLLDWLPRLFILKQKMDLPSNATLVLPREVTAYQRDTLHLLGFDDSSVLQLDNKKSFSQSSVKFRKFYGTSSTNKTHQHPLQGGSSWAAEFLRSAFIKSPAQKAPSNILLDRRDNRRLIISEPDRSALQKAGFVQVFAEDLTFTEQVSLFSSANKIVSAHGAGLANLVFCPNGASVLEVFPAGYSTAAYWMTASAVGVHYSCAVAPTDTSNGPKAHIRDFDLLCPPGVIETWLQGF